MDEPVAGCTLHMRRETVNQNYRCLDNCERCGWNVKVMAERKRRLRVQLKSGDPKKQTAEIRCPYCQARISLNEI